LDTHRARLVALDDLGVHWIAAARRRGSSRRPARDFALAPPRPPLFGAEPTPERVVRDGRVITAAGVSSGIDMALRLAALDDVAQAIQLAIEYDPQPPFDAGSPSKAPGHVVERVRAAAARNAVECPASATG
jgi:hypothetical protein